jgi:hypothetical protein
MKKLFILLTVVFVSIIAKTQTTNKVVQLTGADSAAAAQKELGLYVDSLIKHTTLKSFMDFLYERVSAKEYNEATLAGLYDFFIQQKAREWIARRNKSPAKQ